MVGNERKPWDVRGLKYLNQQSGMGDHTLCHDCNNNTGAWYGDEYKRVAYGMHSLMVQEKAKSNMILEIHNAKIYSLKFFKQVISMFCSVNKESNIDDLREFVLDRNSNLFDQSKYRVYMYLFGDGILKRLPFSAKGLFFDNQPCIQLVSEITTYPLGFLLYSDPNSTPKYIPKALDITQFCECPYDEEQEYQMTIPINECNILFPEDFRTKDEIEKCRNENDQFCKDNGL